MSFNQLPEVLVAEVASKLNCSDLMNLRLSQKRINKIVKGYHLDEGAIYKLRFVRDTAGAEPRITVESYLSSDPSTKIILDPETMNEQTSKYRCVRIFSLVNVPLMPHILSAQPENVLIENFCFESCDVLVTPAEFIDFCKKYSSVSVEKMCLKEEFLNDEVFGQLVKNADLELYHDVDIREVFHYRDFRIDTSLTDFTLNVMLDGRLPKKFCIPQYVVKFSVDVIKKLIQKTLDLGFTSVNWDFGFIGNEPDKEAADKFMEELNSDESNPLTCEYLTDNEFDGLKYKITHKYLDEDAFLIVFKYEQSLQYMDLSDLFADGDFMNGLNINFAEMAKGFADLE